MIKLSQMEPQTVPKPTETVEPNPPFVIDWDIISLFGDKLALGAEIAVLSLIFLISRRLKPFLEEQKMRIMNTDREKITRLMDELGIVADADRVLVCEFIHQRTAAGGDAPRLICTYEITRNSTQRVGFEINEMTCSGSILSAFTKQKLITRTVKEIDNDRYRAFLQSLSVHCVMSYPIELDNQIFGFIAIHYVRDCRHDDVTEQLIKSYADQIAYLLRGQK